MSLTFWGLDSLFIVSDMMYLCCARDVDLLEVLYLRVKSEPAVNQDWRGVAVVMGLG